MITITEMYHKSWREKGVLRDKIHEYTCVQFRVGDEDDLYAKKYLVTFPGILEISTIDEMMVIEKWGKPLP